MTSFRVELEAKVKEERLDGEMIEMLNYEVPMQVDVPEGADAEIDPLMPIQPVCIKSEEPDGTLPRTDGSGGDFQAVVKEEVDFPGDLEIGEWVKSEPNSDTISNIEDCESEEMDVDMAEQVVDTMPKLLKPENQIGQVIIPGVQISGLASRLIPSNQARSTELSSNRRLLREMPSLLPISKVRKDAVLAGPVQKCTKILKSTLPPVSSIVTLSTEASPDVSASSTPLVLIPFTGATPPAPATPSVCLGKKPHTSDHSASTSSVEEKVSPPRQRQSAAARNHLAKKPLRRLASVPPAEAITLVTQPSLPVSAPTVPAVVPPYVPGALPQGTTQISSVHVSASTVPAVSTLYVPEALPQGTNRRPPKPVSVSQILKNPFTSDSRTTAQKVAILNLPRPMPNINTPAGMSARFYDNTPWLCGCATLKQFFCWPCLLFLYHSPESVVWCVQAAAVTNYEIFANTLLAHKTSDPHKEAQKKLSSFLGNAKQQLSQPKKRYKNLQVIEKVRKNRKLLSLLVQTICYVKKDSYDSQVKDYCEIFSHILTSSKPLQQILNDFQGGSSEESISAFVVGHAPIIEQSIETFVKMKIPEELSNARFVTLFLEDFSSVVDVSAVAVITHCINPEGVTQQRMIGFLELDHDRSAEKVFSLLQSIITKYGIRDKLAGYTYSATVVQPSQIADFNEKVEAFCSKSKFFHYQNHDLLGLLFGALSHLNKSCKDFFHNIIALKDLFNKHLVSTFEHFELLDSDGSYVKYDFDYKFIITLNRCFSSMLKTFEKVVQDPEDFDEEVSTQAPIFLAFLQDSTNSFLIMLISLLSLSVWDLAKALKGKILLAKWERILRRTMSNLFHIQKFGFNDVYSAALSKKTRARPGNLVNLFHEVVATAATFLHGRFSSSDFGYCNFDFNVPVQHRPDDRNYFVRLARTPQDVENLLSEYRNFKRNPLLPKDLIGALKCLNEFDLTKAFPEMAVLVDFTMAIPNSWTSLRCPTVERIQAYRLSHNRKPISEQTTCERQQNDLLHEISISKKLSESVIDILASSGGTNEFAYEEGALSYLGSLY